MDVRTQRKSPGKSSDRPSETLSEGLSALDDSIEQLKTLCGLQETGSAMLHVDGATALFHLDKGQFSYLFFQGEKGHAGLQKLMRVLRAGPSECEFHFVRGEPKRLHTALPPTERVLSALADRVKPPAGVRDTARAAARATEASEHGLGIPLTDPMRAVIRAVAVEHFGPNADALCKNALGVDVLRVAFNRLAQGCADTAGAHRFKHALRGKLKPLTSAYYKVQQVDAVGATTMRYSQALLDAVERCAGVWLGADAGPLCRQVFASTDELRDVVDRISQLINDDEAAESFKSSVRAALADLDEE